MNEQQLLVQLRRVFAANEPGSHDIPAFRLTFDAARRRLENPVTARTRWIQSGWAVAVAGMAAIAVVTLLVMRTTVPSLQDDLRLAQSLSYESVWRSPSDSLLAQSTATLLRDTPAMPRAGEPQFSTPVAKEYL